MDSFVEEHTSTVTSSEEIGDFENTLLVSIQPRHYDFEDGDERKKMKVRVEWVTDLGIDEFVDVYDEYLEKCQGLTDDDLRQNSLYETTVEAYEGGYMGCNIGEYEEIVDNPVSEIKGRVREMDEPDWSQLYYYEVQNKNRESVKEWIHSNRVSSRPAVYSRLCFAKLLDIVDSVDELCSLEFRDSFTENPRVQWQDSVGTLERFVPDEDVESYNKVLFQDIITETSVEDADGGFDSEWLRFMFSNTVVGDYGSNDLISDVENVIDEKVDDFFDEG